MAIVETTDTTFEADVFARSELGLVIVDFWAEWCAPCRMLGPLLEELANEYADSITLVKANTEATPQAASQFGVSGIPAVYAVLQRDIIDSFQGAMPQDAIRQWIDGLLSKSDIATALRLSTTKPEEAEEKLRAILKRSPQEAEACIALANILMNSERDQESRQMLETLESRGFLEPAAEQLKAALNLKALKESSDLESLQEAADGAPEDFEQQLALAEGLAGHGQYKQCFEICLELVANDRKATGEKARALMVEVFKVLPDDSELTSEYRRKLSMVLY